MVIPEFRDDVLSDKTRLVEIQLLGGKMFDDM